MRRRGVAVGDFPGSGSGFGLERAATAEKLAPVHVAYDAEHLDLDTHVLQFKPSRAIHDATIIAIGEDGSELGRGAATFDAPPADPWWSITWTQPADARVMMLKLRVATTDGVATNVELIPWSVTIDHDDVTFATNSAVIAPDQQGKLDASVAEDRGRRRARRQGYMQLALLHRGPHRHRRRRGRQSQAVARAARPRSARTCAASTSTSRIEGRRRLRRGRAESPDARRDRRARESPRGLRARPGRRRTPPFKGAYLKAARDVEAAEVAATPRATARRARARCRARRARARGSRPTPRRSGTRSRPARRARDARRRHRRSRGARA